MAAKKTPAKKPPAKKPAAKKAELKTKPTGASVDAFLAKVEPEERRKDAIEVVALLSKVTGEPPRMYGSAIVAFGDTVLTYESGRTLDWFLVGFSPRKASLVFYVQGDFEKRDALMAKLGKVETGKGCLYVKRLSDIDRGALTTLLSESVAFVRARGR